MTHAQWYTQLLMEAGADYRFARAIFDLGFYRLAVMIGLSAARVMGAPTASQRNPRQGKS